MNSLTVEVSEGRAFFDGSDILYLLNDPNNRLIIYYN